MKKICLIACVCVLILPSVVFADMNHLVISQVQITGGSGKTTNDFIEIFNPTLSDVDLQGIRLVKRTQDGATDTLIKSWTDSTIIKAGGYYLWANSNFSDIAAVPDVATSASLANDNGVALRNGPSDTGIIIDSAAWGSAANAFVEGSVFAANPSANEALLRSSDTDNNAADFSISTANPRNTSHASTVTPATPPVIPPSEPSEEQTTTPPPAASTPPPPAYSINIIISEIFANPDGTDTNEEWIEVFNASDSSVDLSGWLLDDEGALIGKDAYTFPQGSLIPPRAYLVAKLQEENFSLNNTGGDAVRLFWPDKTLATMVAYVEPAKEDESFAKNTSSYQWTSLVTKGSENQFAQAQVSGVTSSAQTKIKINEVFPNPAGPDSGGEWIEIVNTGTEPVYLQDWYVDDGEKESPLGSSAWKIESQIVSPGGFAVLVIPAGKFSLDNTGNEIVRLFNENKTLIDSLTFTDSQEDMSYSFVENKWTWTKPTPNALNSLSVPEEEIQPVQIVISEIYPEPERGSKQDEFLELFNPSNDEIDLTGFKLGDLATDYKLSAKIAGLGYLVIKKSESNISLNNSGKEKITLRDAKDVEIASVEYEDAPKDQSYNLLENGSFAWSSSLTPGGQNKFTAAKKVQNTTARSQASESAPAIEENLDEQIEPMEEISLLEIPVADAATGAVSGVSTAVTENSNGQPWLPWLIASFAVNLVFCYSLIRLMTRKAQV